MFSLCRKWRKGDVRFAAFHFHNKHLLCSVAVCNGWAGSTLIRFVLVKSEQ